MSIDRVGKVTLGVKGKEVECYKCPIKHLCSAPTKCGFKQGFYRKAKEEDCPLVKVIRKETK